MILKKVRKQKYPNLDAFDLTGYEELTGDILYKINGGRQVKGNGTKESEYVPSSTKPKESETSSKSAASENSNSSKQSSSNPPSQKSNTEQETQQSKPTCTAAEIAAAKGAAANSYFESQDKKRQENKKEQKNTGTGSTSNSSNSGNDNKNSYSNHSEEKLAKIDERDTKVDNSKSEIFAGGYDNNAPAMGQNLPEDTMEKMMKGEDPLKGRKSALTPAEQAEMARQNAELHKNAKETKVWIVRNDDGLGNEFNATRYIFKDGKLVYQDVVGANAYNEDWTNVNADSTTPDGYYYLSNKSSVAPLYKQEDGSVNSNSLKNVLSLRTRDTRIPERVRDAINYGDRYFHANQLINSNVVYSTINPWGLGCIIGQGGQEHQDEMMKVLMDGVYNPETISVRIISLSNIPGFYK